MTARDQSPEATICPQMMEPPPGPPPGPPQKRPRTEEVYEDKDYEPGFLDWLIESIDNDLAMDFPLSPFDFEYGDDGVGWCEWYCCYYQVNDIYPPEMFPFADVDDEEMDLWFQAKLLGGFEQHNREEFLDFLRAFPDKFLAKILIHTPDSGLTVASDFSKNFYIQDVDGLYFDDSFVVYPEPEQNPWVIFGDNDEYEENEDELDMLWK